MPGLSRKVFRGLGWFAIGSVVLFGLWGLMRMVGLPPDDFHFLGGRYPDISGVSPYLQDGYQGPGIGGEYRVYSWKQSYTEVLAAAKKEAAARGYALTYEGKTAVTWWRGQKGFTIGPGRSTNQREALAGKRVYDPAWVTVMTGNPADDTIWNHIRLALERTDY